MFCLFPRSSQKGAKYCKYQDHLVLVCVLLGGGTRIHRVGRGAGVSICTCNILRIYVRVCSKKTSTDFSSRLPGPLRRVLCFGSLELRTQSRRTRDRPSPARPSRSANPALKREVFVSKGPSHGWRPFESTPFFAGLKGINRLF